MKCPMCDKEMHFAPAHDAQFCGNPECPFEYVVTGLFRFRFRSDLEMEAALLNEEHDLLPYYKFFAVYGP